MSENRTLSDTMEDISRRLKNLEETEKTDEDDATAEGFTTEESETGCVSADNAASENAEEDSSKAEPFVRPEPICVLQIQMKVKYMFDFLLRHAYSGAFGILNIVLFFVPAAFLIYGLIIQDYTYTFACAALTILFGVNPLLVYNRALRQVKLNPMFLKPLSYELSEVGVVVSQGEQAVLTKWSEIVKVYETRCNIICYIANKGVFVFPKQETEGKTEKIKELLMTYTKVAPKRWQDRN